MFMVLKPEAFHFDELEAAEKAKGLELLLLMQFPVNAAFERAIIKLQQVKAKPQELKTNSPVVFLNEVA